MTALKNMAKMTKITPLLAVQNNGHVRIRTTEGDLRELEIVEADEAVEQFSGSSFAPPGFSASDDELLKLPCGASLEFRSHSWTVMSLLLVDMTLLLLDIVSIRLTREALSGL